MEKWKNGKKGKSGWKNGKMEKRLKIDWDESWIGEDEEKERMGSGRNC